MKQVTVGILAHVDAGKTTSIESMLYIAGKLKKTGRVDHQDANIRVLDRPYRADHGRDQPADRYGNTVYRG